MGDRIRAPGGQETPALVEVVAMIIDDEIFEDVLDKLDKAHALIGQGQLGAADRKILRAQALLHAESGPSTPEAPGGFVFSMPFAWTGPAPMPFTVVAMQGDGIPQPTWRGAVSISVLAAEQGTILRILDARGRPLPGLDTPEFTGSWAGELEFEPPGGVTHDFGLKAWDHVSGIAGGSHNCRWIVP